MRGKRCDGDCLSCPLPDCVVDRTEAEYQAEYSAKRYRERKEAGLCVSCGMEPPQPGKVRCPACIARGNRLQNKRYAERKAAGLCIRCGGRKEEENLDKWLCQQCSRRQSNPRKAARIAARREARAEAGLCTLCGRAPARPGRMRCWDCARKMNEYSKARKKAARMRAKEARDGTEEKM